MKVYDGVGAEIAAALEWYQEQSNDGEVKANTIGRTLNSVAMHSHVEFFYYGSSAWTPRKIAHDVYNETESDFALAGISYYLKRNRCSLKKVCLIYSSLESIFLSYLT